MFRKKLAILAAAAMLTLTASSAFAAFADMELIRVYYDRAGAEVFTDLGKAKDLTGAGAVNTIAGSFGSLSGATSFVAYFAIDRLTNEMWASGKTSATTVINGTANGMIAFKNGTASMYTTLNTQGGTTYTGLAADSNSYKNKLSATQGWLANSINNATRLNTEATLAGIIGVAGASTTQNLYYWANGLTTVTGQKTGVLAATIITNANGSTVITSSTPAVATPIPAAFYLMGSGLLGLVGLRRRNRA